MGGNTGWLLRGLAMDSPPFTAACTSLMALDITLLLTVSDTISRDSRMGTPERSRDERVLANRVNAVFWTRGPMMGTRSLNRSHAIRPASVLIQRRNSHTPTAAAIKNSGKA